LVPWSSSFVHIYRGLSLRPTVATSQGGFLYPLRQRERVDSLGDFPDILGIDQLESFASITETDRGALEEQLAGLKATEPASQPI
jgi:hypothetical protein